MDRYIESKPTVTAVQFWNNEKCMLELKELGISKIELSIADGVTSMVIRNAFLGNMEAKEGDYVVKVDDDDGMIVVSPKEHFEGKYRIFDASEECDEAVSKPEKPSFANAENRLLNAFPRPDALNEIYSTGEVDHRGVPTNYSIWRGNHSIMGMTGILFQKGLPGDPDEQEGVEDIDLLEMVHDRLVQRQYVADGEWIMRAVAGIETAIENIIAYEAFCRDNSED